MKNKGFLFSNHASKATYKDRPHIILANGQGSELYTLESPINNNFGRLGSTKKAESINESKNRRKLLRIFTPSHSLTNMSLPLALPSTHRKSNGQPNATCVQATEWTESDYFSRMTTDCTQHAATHPISAHPVFPAETIVSASTGFASLEGRCILETQSTQYQGTSIFQQPNARRITSILSCSKKTSKPKFLSHGGSSTLPSRRLGRSFCRTSTVTKFKKWG